MIDIADIIKLKIYNMRKKENLLNHNGDLEDRVDDIKLRIYKLKLELGGEINTTKKVNVTKKVNSLPQQNHAHKVESKHSAKPSSNLYASLSSNPSFRNAVRI